MPNLTKKGVDVGLWRSPAPGAAEVFDAGRFGAWLDTLADEDADSGAQKLTTLDLPLVVAGFSRHVTVFDAAALSSYTALDGEQVSAREFGDRSRIDIGGFVVIAKQPSAWEAIGDLLHALQSEHPEYFVRLMRECVRRSNGPREADGFHHLLDDDEQAMFDLAVSRDEQREAEGYVSAGDARAFLETARRSALNAAASHTPAIAPARVSSRLDHLRAHIERHPDSESDLARLANTLISGCSVQGRAFTVDEGRRGAAAICNLGLEHRPAGHEDRNLITAFEIGFTVLHQRVSVRTAERLLEVIGVLECGDRDIQFDLHVLRRELTRALADGRTWKALGALEVLMMLDAPTWAGLVGLLDECPVMHAALSASRDHRQPIGASDFEFISSHAHIPRIYQFLENLLTTL